MYTDLNITEITSRPYARPSLQRRGDLSGGGTSQHQRRRGKRGRFRGILSFPRTLSQEHAFLRRAGRGGRFWGRLRGIWGWWRTQGAGGTRTDGLSWRRPELTAAPTASGPKFLLRFAAGAMPGHAGRRGTRRTSRRALPRRGEDFSRGLSPNGAHEASPSPGPCPSPEWLAGLPGPPFSGAGGIWVEGIQP